MLVLTCPRIARDPFRLERVIFRPGKTIPESQLWPDERAPRIPVLIECARSPRSFAGVCAHKGEVVYVLWRYDAQEWLEVARCYSMHGEWWPALHPLILRELARSNATPPDPDLAAIAERTAAYLDTQISDLSDAERSTMLVKLHEQLLARIAATDLVARLHAA